MSTFNPQTIIQSLAQNESTFLGLFSAVPADVHLWRPAPKKWNLLDIICHLYDEEREDFRARIQSVITNHSQPFTPIDPEGWVSARSYTSQDYDQKLQLFLAERQASVRWLKELDVSDWNVAYQHPKFGPMSAAFLLSNWLAHDYLHVRQVTRLKFEFLREMGSEPLSYAGDW